MSLEYLAARLSGKQASITQEEHGYRCRVGAPRPDEYFSASIRNGTVEGNMLILSRGAGSDSCLSMTNEQVVLLRDILVAHCEDKEL